jgi:hypothetical protein
VLSNKKKPPNKKKPRNSPYELKANTKTLDIPKKRKRKRTLIDSNKKKDTNNKKQETYLSTCDFKIHNRCEKEKEKEYL